MPGFNNQSLLCFFFSSPLLHMHCAQFSAIFYFMIKTKLKSIEASGSFQACSLVHSSGCFLVMRIKEHDQGSEASS